MTNREALQTTLELALREVEREWKNVSGNEGYNRRKAVTLMRGYLDCLPHNANPLWNRKDYALDGQGINYDTREV
jgi:hypothetical protein